MATHVPFDLCRRKRRKKSFIGLYIKAKAFKIFKKFALRKRRKKKREKVFSGCKSHDVVNQSLNLLQNLILSSFSFQPFPPSPIGWKLTFSPWRGGKGKSIYADINQREERFNIKNKINFSGEILYKTQIPPTENKNEKKE